MGSLSSTCRHVSSSWAAPHRGSSTSQCDAAGAVLKYARLDLTGRGPPYYYRALRGETHRSMVYGWRRRSAHEDRDIAKEASGVLVRMVYGWRRRSAHEDRDFAKEASGVIVRMVYGWRRRSAHEDRDFAKEASGVIVRAHSCDCNGSF